MRKPADLADIWRGDILESRHAGHLVVAHATSGVLFEWGDPDLVMLPRSSAKMIQALPLVESGAAEQFGLTSEHLALACASHNGAAIHTDRVSRWLSDLGLSEDDLRCGPQFPADRDAANALTCGGHAHGQRHNNCSGKHTGFLTLGKHLKAGAEYIYADHPVQMAAREAFEDVTDMTSPDWAVDGCSAPNFATTTAGLAKAMARFAAPQGAGVRAEAMSKLVQAMIAHPDLVAGEGRACTELMRAMKGRAAIKTGAEGVFVAIVPEREIGVALKVTDGATRAAEAAIAAVLVALGVLEAEHPATLKFLNAPITNRRDLVTGRIAAAPDLVDGLSRI